MGIKYWSLMLLLSATLTCGTATAALFSMELFGHVVSSSLLGFGLLATPLLASACCWCQKYAISTEIPMRTINRENFIDH